ncbi:MAG: hypothetical protein R6U92_00780, partial [Bacillota bacterium]
MGIIRTVTGDIAPEELGFCQTHEHVWCDIRMGERHFLRPTVTKSPLDTMIFDDKERMLEELKAYYEMGGRALVDVTTNHWRQDLKTLQELSEESGVKIVATGGFYTESSVPRWVDTLSIREITDKLVAEVEEGDEDGVKCGLYKSGIYRGRIEGPELKGLRAVARAIQETGAAMTTHTTGVRRYEVPGGTMGIQHLKIFKEEGTPAHRLIVGHVDERPNVNVLSSLADEGCFIQFDVIGKKHWLLEETRAQLIAELKRRGHLDKILLGTDRCRKVELYKDLGGLGYTYLFEHFFGVLKEYGGITDAEIKNIMEDNPARALTLV